MFLSFSFPLWEQDKLDMQWREMKELMGFGWKRCMQAPCLLFLILDIVGQRSMWSGSAVEGAVIISTFRGPLGWSKPRGIISHWKWSSVSWRGCLCVGGMCKHSFPLLFPPSIAPYPSLIPRDAQGTMAHLCLLVHFSELMDSLSSKCSFLHS